MNETNTQAGWPTFKRSLPRVFRRRCPQCGVGALFATHFRLQDACDHCGLQYRREQGSMTGAMYLSAAVTEFFAAGAALALFFFTDFGLAVGLTVGLLATAAFCVWFSPYSKSIWVAVEYSTDVSNKEDWVDPR